MKNEIKTDARGYELKKGDKVCFLNPGFRCYTGLVIGTVVETEGRYVKVQVSQFTVDKMPASLYKLYSE